MAKDDSDEYSEMLLLEDLESLAEEMDEIGVRDIDEVRRWLAVPRTDQQAGTPPVADEVALKSILDLMEELEVTSRDDLAARIRTMQETMDWDG
jgi:hypothetical protein